MMESAIGLLTCLLLLLLLGGGVGFLMMNQRVSRLQKQIDLLELRLNTGAMPAPKPVEETLQFIQPVTPAPPVQPASVLVKDVQANQPSPISSKPQSLPQPLGF
ncbi:MAG: hypothetical protein ACK47M_23330, partial [Caldilinea sp.]